MIYLKLNSELFKECRQVLSFFDNVIHIFGQTENPHTTLSKFGSRFKDVGKQQGQSAIIKEPEISNNEFNTSKKSNNNNNNK